MINRYARPLISQRQKATGDEGFFNGPQPPPSRAQPQQYSSYQGNVYQGNLPGRSGMPAFPGYQQPKGNLERFPQVSDGPGYGYGFGDDIRRPTGQPTPPPPAPPPAGRIMDGPGSGYGYGNDAYYLPPGTGGGMPPPRRDPYINQGGVGGREGPYGPQPGGFPPAPQKPPQVLFRPGQASSIQDSDTSRQPSPEEYRQSINEERARAAKQDAAAAAKRQKIQQGRQGTTFDGYDNPVYDPMVAANEQSRIYREQRAADRGEGPRKTQMEIDTSSRQQETARINSMRQSVDQTFPGMDPAAKKAILQRVQSYGESPQEAYENSGIAAMHARNSAAEQARLRQPPPTPVAGFTGRPQWR